MFQVLRGGAVWVQRATHNPYDDDSAFYCSAKPAADRFVVQPVNCIPTQAPDLFFPSIKCKTSHTAEA